GILSVVGSIYDPLGFLQPFTLPAKLIVQELCKEKLGRDENITQTFSQRWTGWLIDLNKMAEFKEDRCMKPANFGQIKLAQLHHFSDTSESGYGTVSYLRLEDDNKEVHVAFIMGKARVAPVKQMTIPRMEITAAVLAVRVDTMPQKELQLQLDKSIFWTDNEASRGLIADCFLSSKKWIKGPEFLCKPHREWPKLNLESAISANDLESSKTSH
ncbi:uncharacterized protein LOC129711872, partial [Leucoraja erinacea]|uniref:uncharacterized protein LOC129711872 n=1 Tax=Leucoraja erinaceus TaxID=7782 RepID=UPI002453DC89